MLDYVDYYQQLQKLWNTNISNLLSIVLLPNLARFVFFKQISCGLSTSEWVKLKKKNSHNIFFIQTSLICLYVDRFFFSFNHQQERQKTLFRFDLTENMRVFIFFGASPILANHKLEICCIGVHICELFYLWKWSVKCGY